MLSRPAAVVHRCSIQAAAVACLSGSEASLAYTRTCVSTKTGTVVEIVSGRKGAAQLPGLAAQEALHRARVRLSATHVLTEEVPEQRRDAHVPPSSLDPRPPSRLLVEGDGNVAHDTSFVYHGSCVNEPSRDALGTVRYLGLSVTSVRRLPPAGLVEEG